jgi:hypothetical protein
MDNCRPNDHNSECSGRHTCTMKVLCPVCSWVGLQKDAYHAYRSISVSDLEPFDYCPQCGSGELVSAT